MDKNSNDENIKKLKMKLNIEKNRNLSHHQYLSRMSLGAIIHLIKENKLQNLRNRSYHWENILKTTEKMANIIQD